MSALAQFLEQQSHSEITAKPPQAQIVKQHEAHRQRLAKLAQKQKKSRSPEKK